MPFIDVPFSEKDEAKAAGAIWKPDEKKWFVPEGFDMKPFDKWIPSPFMPTEPLFVDLVPSTAWFFNLRSELKTSEWEAVKKATFVAAEYRCQACGGRGKAHPVECHERFSYSEFGIQRFERTAALCPTCHMATHFGLASVRGKSEIALRQLCKVNDWTREEATKHVSDAMQKFSERSRMKWTLDARLLFGFVELSDETIMKITSKATGA